MQLDSSKSEEAKKKREKEEESKKAEKERMKREIEIWMNKHSLPGEMKIGIMQSAMQILEENINLVHVENVLRQLPDEELRNSVKRLVYLDLLKKVSSLISYDKLAK